PFLARLGRSTARHKVAYVVAWLLLVVVGFVTSLGLLGNDSLFDRLKSGDIVAPGEAQTGRDLLADTDGSGLTVMLRVDGADLSDPGLTEAVRAVVRRVEAVEGVGDVDSPMTTR